MEILARGIRLPGPARRFMDRELMQYLHWGTTGPMWHRGVLAASVAGCVAGGVAVVRRGLRSGPGSHRRRGLPADATGRLDIDRELHERTMRERSGDDQNSASA